ncbi:LOW QUALITY PROTEIN: hypothetical protein CFOL_v3_34142, partial [Cephalotus follicularis]
NHDSRPTGSASLPEVNATSSHFRGRGRGQQRQKWLDPGQSSNAGQAKSKKGNCNRCGMEDHWRACRTAKHWVDLYQASLKDKGKQIETNF